MQFDKALFGQQLEWILAKHKTPDGISWVGIKNFTFEARTYSESLFGSRSMDILPVHNKRRNTYKMTIYVNPTPHKFGCMVDYYFDVPALRRLNQIRG